MNLKKYIGAPQLGDNYEDYLCDFVDTNGKYHTIWLAMSDLARQNLTEDIHKFYNKKISEFGNLIDRLINFKTTESHHLPFIFKSGQKMSTDTQAESNRFIYGSYPRIIFTSHSL